MAADFERRLLGVWLALSTLTVVALLLDSFDGDDAGKQNAALTTAAIAIALIKIRLILREFMEVRHAPRLLGRLTDLWLLVTGAVLLGIYAVGMASSTTSM